MKLGIVVYCPTPNHQPAPPAAAASNNTINNAMSPRRRRRGRGWPSSRLIGAPVVTQHGTGLRRVFYTTWDPPEATNVCGEGVTSVSCMKLERSALSPTEFTCALCGDMDGDGEDDAIAEVETGRAKPTTPAVADGQVYLVTDEGPIRLNNQSGDGEGIDGSTPGQHAPQVFTVSWRETF